MLKANLDSTAGEIQRIEQELVKQREQDSGIEVQICQQRDRIAEIDSLYESILDETEKLNLRIEQIAAQAGQAAQELNSLISCQNEQSVKLNSMRSELSALASTAQALEDRDTAIAQETASSAEKLRQFEKDKQQCFEQLKTVSEQELEKQNQLKGYSLIAGAKKQRAEAAAERLTQLKIERNSITSRVNMLTEMEKEYQGYSRAVKTVMQDAARGVLKNVHGTAAQLMKTEEKYAVAIETALGAAMQNIIVSTEQDAKAGINMLKRRDCGRATFMPMSFIHGSVLNERGLENEPGFEGIAVDLISFDGKYRNIYNFLLGRTAVAGNIDDAINISRKYSNRFRIVTLDGQVINAGGTMTGGSTSKNAGIISRSNELEKLRQQAQLLSEDMLKAEKEAAESQRELVKIQQQLEVCQSEKRELENQRLKL